MKLNFITRSQSWSWVVSGAAHLLVLGALFGLSPPAAPLRSTVIQVVIPPRRPLGAPDAPSLAPPAAGSALAPVAAPPRSSPARRPRALPPPSLPAPARAEAPAPAVAAEPPAGTLAVPAAVASPAPAGPATASGPQGSAGSAASAPPGSAASAPRGGQGDLQGYLSTITRAVSARQRYPAQALLMEQQGDVLVLVSLRADGALSVPPRVLQSSGHPLLDQEALRMVTQAAPFAPLPAPQTSATLRVPIRFHLPD